MDGEVVISSKSLLSPTKLPNLISKKEIEEPTFVSVDSILAINATHPKGLREENTNLHQKVEALSLPLDTQASSIYYLDQELIRLV